MFFNSSTPQFPLLFSSFRPIFSVQVPIANGFGNVVALDMLACLKVGYGACHL